MLNNCVFCQEFTGDRSTYFYEVMGNKQSRILYEDDSFIILPTVGSFIEGYLLIATREHKLCMGELPIDKLNRLDKLIDIMRNMLRDIYQKDCIVFEHGSIAENKKNGTSVEHAHVHILPTGADLEQKLNNHSLYPLSSILALKQCFENQKPYLYYQNTSGKQYIIESSNTPSQFLRKVSAEVLGKIDESWNWRIEPGRDNISRTMDRITPELINKYMEMNK